ncbi:MAG TPA: GspMb/PilO family protein [Gemmatimonadales bacterium]|jgi:hypothetical protein|nr:GspMb/PilO family protein [Gemmatimonadales bacterium]
MTARERVVLIAGALAVASAAFLTRGVPAVVGGIHRLRTSVAERTELLAALRARVAAGDSISATAEALRERIGGLAAVVLAGRSEPAALEDLIARIAYLAERAQARVQRAERLPDSTRGGLLRRVAVRVELQCDLGALLAFFRALGRDSTAISTDAVRITAADPHSAPSAPEMLGVELRLAGWYLEGSPRVGSNDGRPSPR